MANKITISSEEPEVEPQPKEPSRLTDTMQKVADFNFSISSNWIVKQIPYAMFLVGLTLVHIWNAHNVEKLIRKTDRLARENKELRSEYISIQSELMSESKQSSVAAKLDSIGIKELTAPPFKITKRGNEY